MTSYQKRKNEIAYYEQCIDELIYISKSLCSQLIDNNINPILSHYEFGITGDMFITPYNNGDFIMLLLYLQKGGPK
jgi:hypothetical protein